MNEGILKILIPIITFILGTIISMFNIKSQRKLSNRCYPNIEEAYFPINLDKLDINSGTKMYYCGDYAHICNSDNIDITSDIIYLKVTNLGPGHMMNCDFNIVVTRTDFNEEWNMNLNVKLIQNDEMILIPTLKESMLHKEIIIKSVVVNYLTTSGEKMRYSYKLDSIQEDITFINDSLHVIKFKWLKNKIYSYKGQSSLFLFLNFKKNN